MPVGVAREPQLVARAEHAVGDHAHLLGALDPAVAGQHRARQGDRDALAGGDVRRTAHDGQRLAAVAQGDGGEREPVRPRVPLHGEQLARDDAAASRRPSARCA